MMKVIDLLHAPFADDSYQEGGTVVEISLLLEASLLERLDEVAEEQGITAASLIRRLLRASLHLADEPAPVVMDTSIASGKRPAAPIHVNRRV